MGEVVELGADVFDGSTIVSGGCVDIAEVLGARELGERLVHVLLVLLDEAFGVVDGTH